MPAQQSSPAQAVARLASPAESLLALLAFALPAATPLLTGAPTRSADGLLHIFRLVELDHLWRSGVLYSRWWPDLAYGLGLPLQNYYAPLAYYITTPLHYLGLGLALTAAFNVSLIAALLAGAGGTWLLAREILPARAGAGGALVAALAFLYSPYVLFNAFARANLAEQWALALAPWALGQFARLARNPTALRFLSATLLLAAVLLSHNVTGFVFAPVLIGWMAVVAFQARERRRVLIWLVAAFALGLALSAFFWLPALVEREWVQIQRVIVTPDFDYHFNMVSPGDLLAPLPRADTGRLNPDYPSTLGIVQVALCLAGLFALILNRRERWALRPAFLLLAGLGLVLLMLPFSVGVWERVPLLSFVQLPSRLRGPSALLLAPAAGLAVYLLPARWRASGTGLAVVALFVGAVPLLYPRYTAGLPANPDLADMFAYEQRSGAIGTTSFGEYMPAWVEDVPDHSPLEPAYREPEGTLPERLVTPEGVEVCGVRRETLEEQICVSSPAEWRAVYRAFYFPGWRAWIDAQPVEVSPTERDGMISFRVPAGRRQIRVARTDTPVETAANFTSLVAAAALLAAMLLLGRKREAREERVQVPLLPRPLILVALVLLVFKVFYLDRQDSFLVVHYDGGPIAGVATPMQLGFGDELELLGMDRGRAPETPGAPFRITLYWRARQPLTRNLSTYVHLTQPDGRVLAQKDSLHPANVPTSLWDLDAYVADLHAFNIPPDIPPGLYELRAGVYDAETGQRLKTAAGNEYILLDRIEIGQ